MPELPEVEAVVRKLNAAAPWRRIVACGQFRPTTASNLELSIGASITGITRRGKNILIQLDNGAFLHIHLKMTGNLTVLPDARFRPATVRAWLTLDDGRALVLDDPRALGRLRYLSTLEPLLRNLGIEPLSESFTAQYLIHHASHSRKPIKLFLMDQTVVAGLGNIYAAEALFASRIHPARETRLLSAPRLRTLHAAIVDVLRLGLESAVRAYSKPGTIAEGEDFPAAVYGREGERCHRCGATVRRMPQGGRSTYFCPRCQR